MSNMPNEADLWVDIEDSGHAVLRGGAARVSDQAGDEMVISAPRYVDGTAAPEPGGDIVLRWTGERGISECHAELLSVSGGERPSWTVRVTGPVERVQRRNFARAAIMGVVAVVPVGTDAPVAVMTGNLEDLSEGGLRANLSGPPLDAGTAVEAHLELDATPVTLPGRVLRADALPAKPGLYETVVIFDVQEVHAARLRRVVLRQQARARQERMS